MAAFFSSGAISLILQLLGVVFKWYGASDEVLNDYLTLVNSAAKTGLITADSQDKLTAQRQAILERQKKAAAPPNPKA